MRSYKPIREGSPARLRLAGAIICWSALTGIGAATPVRIKWVPHPGEVLEYCDAYRNVTEAEPMWTWFQRRVKTESLKDGLALVSVHTDDGVPQFKPTFLKTLDSEQSEMFDPYGEFTITPSEDEQSRTIAYPKRPVNVGDTWARTVHEQEGTCHTTYTLTGLQKIDGLETFAVAVHCKETRKKLVLHSDGLVWLDRQDGSLVAMKRRYQSPDAGKVETWDEALGRLGFGETQPSMLRWLPRSGPSHRFVVNTWAKTSTGGRRSGSNLGDDYVTEVTASTVEISTAERVLRLTTDGVDQAVPSQSEEIDLVRDRHGAFISYKTKPEAPGEGGTLACELLVFPAYALNRGQSWGHDYSADPSQGLAPTTMTFHYRGSVSVGGFRAFCISYDFKEYGIPHPAQGGGMFLIDRSDGSQLALTRNWDYWSPHMDCEVSAQDRVSVALEPVAAAGERFGHRTRDARPHRPHRYLRLRSSRPHRILHQHLE